MHGHTHSKDEDTTSGHCHPNFDILLLVVESLIRNCHPGKRQTAAP
jgi:hypothetical protein